MDVVLSAGEPLVPAGRAVGRRSTVVVDDQRSGRALALDCWYPAHPVDQALSVYQLMPGIGFTASALADPEPAPGPHPLVVFSHGRTGTRSSYAMLCEGLAARGYVVVAPDHPGDTLMDWLSGAAVDDATNETQRVDDVRFILDAVLEEQAGLEPVGGLDGDKVALAGHSYGAHTVLAVAGAAQHGPPIRAVAGLQSFTRTMRRSVLEAVRAPSLLIAGARDATCPPGLGCLPSLRGARARRCVARRHRARRPSGLQRRGALRRARTRRVRTS